MQEIQKDNLSEQFLGEIDGVYAFIIKFLADGLVTDNQLIKFLLNFEEKLAIPIKEFLGGYLNIKGIFQSRERGIIFVICQNIN